MDLYHGGYCEVKTPIIKESTFTKYFGTGFYCTEIKGQAERWAIKFDTPTISSYKYEEDDSLNILKFEIMSEEWLDFIISCRNANLHDQVYNFINDYINQIFTRSAFWELAKFKYPTHQIAFCSTKSLKAVKFVESEEVSQYGNRQRNKRRK